MSRNSANSGRKDANAFARAEENAHLWTDHWVAALINVSRPTLRRWRKQNKGPPFVKLGPEKGAAIRYIPEDVAAWLAARRSGGEQVA
jgi:predicted DNA-binding transcriptional regulator AlpA